MWDPSAIMTFTSIIGAVLLAGILSIGAVRSGHINADSLKLAIAFPTLMLISGLTLYSKIGSDALTVVFGAVIGYVLGGRVERRSVEGNL